MLNIESVHLWRDAEGAYHFEWDGPAPGTQVSVQPSVAGGQIDYSGSGGAGASVTGLPPHRRHYFTVRDQYGSEVVVTERKLGMQGTPNFRDFGGYKTTDGGQVKWGYLFRSGQLSRLTDQDVRLFGSLDLDLVCDFRREEEQKGDPTRLPDERPPRLLSLPITPGSNTDFFSQAGSQADGSSANSSRQMFDLMVSINRDLALEQTAMYTRMFSEILAINDARFLVHCAAGKDRTGFAVALVLLALGVPRSTVLEDYLMTSRYFNPGPELERIRLKYQLHLPDEAILPMLQVHETYLLAALEEIESRYASVEDYLARELGVGPAELAELRGRYLA